MITPSFGLTATERVLPRLSLDFTSASLDSRITFTRSGNTATVINSSGNVVASSANTPRFDYTLATGGACKGLLIEEARTNAATNSIFDGAVAGTPGTAPTGWSIGFATGSITSVSSGYYAAGNRLRITTSGQRHYFAQTQVVSAASTYTLSYVANVISGNAEIQNLINLNGVPSGGSITFYRNGVAVSASTVVPAGLSTLSIVITTGLAILFDIRVGPGAADASTSVIDIEMPQFEQGAFPTSYIPTAASQVTRTADVATMTGTNFSNWYSAGAGGVVTRVLPSTVSGTRPTLQFDDATSNEVITLRGSTTNPELVIVDGGAPQAQIDAGTIAANTAYNLGAAWNTDNCAAAVDGGAAVTDSTATIPTVTQARLGSDGTNYLNGQIQTVRYWPQRIINTEVQAFSK